MKQFFTTLFVASLLQASLYAQLTTLPDGGNKRAVVGERVGLTDVTVQYSRPAVKGRTGKIWGELVPFGFTDQGFGTSKAAPWRAGANEGTTIEFSTDVTIEGERLPAGKYGFFIATGPDVSTLIFSTNNTAWGSFFYDSAEDMLRVRCKQSQLDKPVEFLQYVFTDQSVNSAIISLQWENRSFSFKIATDVIKEQLALFRKELQTEKGFSWQAFVQAAQWCADNNTNLPEALQWAEKAISEKYVGVKNFTTLSVKARVLGLLGQQDQAALAMKEAMPLGTASELHNYARQLMLAKKLPEAAEVFKYNYRKSPNTFTTNMGMVRAMSSEGKYKEALKYAKAALLQAPDDLNKQNVEGIIAKLKAGQDAN